MTDKKEIIIDGVDVSECEHQYYKKCKIDYDEWNNEIIRYNECQNNPNCHFKQLKRKEQVLDEIKEIAEGNIRIADLEGLNGVYRRGLAEQILQKISEVEDG